MSDKTYFCPECLATAHHKGKYDICNTKLIMLEDLSEEQLSEIMKKFKEKNNKQGELYGKR